MLYLVNLNVRVDSTNSLKKKLLDTLKIKDSDLISYKIIKKSIDARHKNNICYAYQIVADVKLELVKFKKYIEKNDALNLKIWKYTDRPVIIGFGPSSMFSALLLARMQARPIIIERGSEVLKRVEKVDNFFNNMILDEESNVCFGEGGAGTFSDGKLQTNVNSIYNRFILEEFVRYGADPDILVNALPHIGTDVLRKVVLNMRKDLINMGATFYFNTLFYDYIENEDSIIIKAKNGEKELLFETKHLILGIGHSAHDTYRMLANHNLKLTLKPFSVGLRIEHLAKDINNIQYGKFSNYLPTAYYKMAVHLKERSVYTFCMCPGGYVVPSQTKKETILTNGMSYKARDYINSNSALLVEVKPSDFSSDDPFLAIDFINNIEKKAFNKKFPYKAPLNLVKEFLKGEVATSFRKVKPSYVHGTYFSDFKDILPDFVIESLKEALPLFNNKMKGFLDDDALLIAPEVRSSAPLRIERIDYKAINSKFIYPIGEGAGYAGGITSSALDGIKCILSIEGEMNGKKD